MAMIIWYKAGYPKEIAVITMLFDPVPGTDICKVVIGGVDFYVVPGPADGRGPDYRAGWFTVSLNTYV